MGKGYASAVGMVLVVCLVGPAVLLADVYDEFYDGKYEGDPNDPGYDPNVWDIDNPDWTINPFIGPPYYTAEGGALRLCCQAVMGYAFLGAEATDGDLDANTSTTWLDDTAGHYALSYVIVVQPLTGMAGLWIHFNATTWEAYVHEYEPRDGWMSLTSYSGTVYGSGASDHRFWCVVEDDYVGDPNYYNPNYPADANYLVDPNYYNDDFHPDHPDPNGYWLLVQFDPNGPHRDPNCQLPTDSNDPNYHWLCGAFWNGGKFDWDGEYDLQVNVTITEDLDPNEVDPDMFHHTEGTSVVASFCGGMSGSPSDIAYDSIEFRWGYYTSLSRKLTLKLKDCCELTVDPDLLDDPNHDPNNYNEPRRYTDGTAVVLDAVVPCGNKAFKKWTVKGPNDAGDPLYQIVVDTNEVVYLTMDGDYLVKATCKCGSGVEPFAGMVLLVLGVGVVIRRLT